MRVALSLSQIALTILQKRKDTLHNVILCLTKGWDGHGWLVMVLIRDLLEAQQQLYKLLPYIIYLLFLFDFPLSLNC